MILIKRLEVFELRVNLMSARFSPKPVKAFVYCVLVLVKHEI